MLFIPLVQGQKRAEAGSRHFQNSFSSAFGAPRAHENGFYWERGRLAQCHLLFFNGAFKPNCREAASS
jgi:hypothetical protein